MVQTGWRSDRADRAATRSPAEDQRLRRQALDALAAAALTLGGSVLLTAGALLVLRWIA